MFLKNKKEEEEKSEIYQSDLLCNVGQGTFIKEGSGGTQ